MSFSMLEMWRGDKNFRLKMMFLSCIYFFILAAYTVMKELKDSVFTYTVGRTYIPDAKIASMIVLVPAILLFAFLVDRMRRYQLLMWYAIAFGVIGLICALLLGHPTIGLDNTATSPYRLFGWFFYFFIEGYSPFVVALFWAFANSISTPQEAQSGYSYMVAVSRIGGALSAGFAAFFFSTQFNTLTPMLSSTGRHQVVVFLCSLFLLCVPILLLLLMKKVPGYSMHGYEAVYQAEKEKKKQSKDKTGLFAGLKLLIENPYVMGIFAYIFFYEVLNVVLAYQRLAMTAQGASCASELSSALSFQIFLMHSLSFFVSLFLTPYILKKFGEKGGLLFVPISIGTVVLLLVLFGSWWCYSLPLAFIIIRSINYAISYPIRESLYVPTLKDIKFKSKSWIDSFGSKFSKTVGSGTNKAIDIVVRYSGAGLVYSVEFLAFGFIIGGWIIVALLLGRRYDKAIKNNEVIGDVDGDPR
jgi:AAA family ATP:ADP antiporter